MEQLIQITTTPGKYDLEINPGRLEYKSNHIPQVNLETTPSKLSLDTKHIQVRIDSYQARKSLGTGHMNVSDIAAYNTNNASKNISSYISNTISQGRALGDLTSGATIGALMRQKMIDHAPSTTLFLPKAGGVQISWDEGAIQTNYQPQKTDFNWDIKNVEFTFTRGSVSLKILEPHNVDIEYIGEPLYFPRSAAAAYKQTTNMG